jgi:hypothetical protein
MSVEWLVGRQLCAILFSDGQCSCTLRFRLKKIESICEKCWWASKTKSNDKKTRQNLAPKMIKCNFPWDMPLFGLCFC